MKKRVQNRRAPRSMRRAGAFAMLFLPLAFLPIVFLLMVFLLPGLAGAPWARAQEASPWSEGEPMPTCRSELAAAELDGWIYAAGGLARGGALDAVERYDPAARRWERRAPLPEPLH